MKNKVFGLKSKIWLSPPHMSGYEKKFIDEAFNLNWIAPSGPNVTGFEEDIEKYLKNGLGLSQDERDKLKEILLSQVK